MARLWFYGNAHVHTHSPGEHNAPGEKDDEEKEEKEDDFGWSARTRKMQVCTVLLLLPLALHPQQHERLA